MKKSVSGNKEPEVRLAKVLRMAEDSDPFRVVWECLVADGIVADWERGAADDEDIREDARRVLGHFDILEGRASSTRQKPGGRAMVEVPVEPTEREKDMTAAFREYLAVHAAQRPIVRRFRMEYLPDGRLYTDDHDIALLLKEQHVAKAGTTNLQQYLDENRGKPNDGAVRLEFSAGPPPDDMTSPEEMAEWTAEWEIDQERQMEEAWWGKGREDISWYDFDPTEEDVAQERQRQKEWEGHFGTQLEILGEWLATRYPWENVGDAVVFLISGKPPRLAQPLRATQDDANAAYSITFSPWISEETVVRAYRNIQPIHLRLPGNKTLRVLRFVSGQADDDGDLPTWGTLCDRWNAANPDERFSDRSALYKAYRRAVEALLARHLLLTENAATWS